MSKREDGRLDDELRPVVITRGFTSHPAGSVVIFAESTLHGGTEWKNPNVDRVSVFNCYNSLWSQWHRLNLDPDVILAMPKKRQSLFRGVYCFDGRAKGREEKANQFFALDNRCL